VSFAKSISPDITIPDTTKLVVEAALRISRGLGWTLPARAA
jgi:hypothetical protein